MQLSSIFIVFISHCIGMFALKRLTSKIATKPFARLSSSDSTNFVKNMTVQEFNNILKSNKRTEYQIIDVREKDELQIAKITGADIINLPLRDANNWSSQVLNSQLLDSEKPTLCLCHHGMRSAQVANFLVSKADFSNVYNIQGGIHAYAEEIDPSVGFY